MKLTILGGLYPRKDIELIHQMRKLNQRTVTKISWHFAWWAKQLFELLQYHHKDLNEHKGKGQKGKLQGQVSSRKPVLGNQEHLTALEDLIHQFWHINSLTSHMFYIQMHPKMACVSSFTNNKKVKCMFLHMHQECWVLLRRIVTCTRAS